MYDVYFSHFTYGRQSIPAENMEQGGNLRPVVALTFIYHARAAGKDKSSTTRWPHAIVLTLSELKHQTRVKKAGKLNTSENLPCILDKNEEKRTSIAFFMFPNCWKFAARLNMACSDPQMRSGI